LSRFFLIVLAIIGLSILAGLVYLEFKIHKNKATTSLELAQNYCFQLPKNCVHKIAKKQMVLFCRNSVSLNIRKEALVKVFEEKKLTNIFSHKDYSVKKMSNLLQEKSSFLISFKNGENFILNSFLKDSVGNHIWKNIQTCVLNKNVKIIRFNQ
jgi:hypothetical protein